MSIYATVQAELKALQQEARRKYPNVKEAAERALNRMAAIPNKSPGLPELREICAAEDIWKSCTLAIEAHNVRLAVMGLKLLQRCLQHDLVPPSPLVGIVGCVTRIEWDRDFSGDETLQLTLLQVLLSTFMPQHRSFSSGALANALSQCFILHGSRFNDVQNTSVAALRQLTAQIFERLAAVTSPHVTAAEMDAADEERKASEASAAELHGRNAYSMLKDLCYLADGEAGNWLRAQSTPAVRLLALQLLQFVLSNHAATLLQIPAFGQLIHDQVSQVVVRGLNTPLNGMEFRTLILIHKMAGALLVDYHSATVDLAEALLNHHLRLLEHPEVPSWDKFLVLLVFKQWSEDSTLLSALFRHAGSPSPNADQQVPSSLLLFLCSFVQRMFADLPSGAQLVLPSGRSQIVKALRLDGPVDQEQLMACRMPDAVLLCLDCMSGLLSAMAQLVTGANSYDPQGLILEGVWMQSLSTLSVMLDRTEDEEVVQTILRCFQICAHSLGIADRQLARDSFLMVLCKHTLPEDVAALATYVVTPKNIQVLKVLFNLANGLAAHLGPSWCLLLKSFQQLDVLLGAAADSGAAKRSTSSPSPTSPVQPEAVFDAPGELPLLASLMAGAFDHTKLLFDDTLVGLIDALIKVSDEALAPTQAAEVSTTPVVTMQDSLAKRQKLFGCKKMVEVVQINLSRIELLLDTVYNYLATVALTNRDPAIRQAAVEYISTIIQTVLTTSQAGPETAKKNDKLQEQVVRILETIYCKSEHGDVRLATLNHMFNIVNVAGQELRPEAWRILLAVLHIAATGTKTEVQQGFRCVQFACSEYMTHFQHERVHQLISVVGAYSQQTVLEDKVNINLSAIQLLMSLADFCAQNPNSVDATHWNWLFHHIRDVARDVRPEVRNSAMKTLFSALTVHGQQSLPAECWSPCLWDVLLKVLDGVNDEALKAEQLENMGGTPQMEGALKSEQGRPSLMVHHSRDTAVKQWNESRCTAVEGVVRMVRVFNERLTAAVPDLLEAMQCLFKHLQQAALHWAEEVSIVGTRSIHVIFTDYKVYPDTLWATAWETWQKLAEILSGNDAPAKAKVPMLMVEGFTDLYQKSRDAKAVHENFTPEHLKRLLCILDKVLQSPAIMDTYTYPSKLQVATLGCIEILPPLPERSLEHQCFKVLIGHLPDHNTVQACLQGMEAQDAAGAEAILSNFGHVEHCRKVLETIEKVYSANYLTDDVQQEVYPWLVKMYGAAMLTRYINAGAYTLWKSAIPSFRRVTQLTLPKVGSLERCPSLDEMWMDICRALENFILFQIGSHGTQRPSAVVGEEEELVLLEMLRDNILPNCGASASKECVQRLVSIVEQCSKAQNKRALANAGINTLFYLCQRVVKDDLSPNQRVGAVTLPILTARCKALLSQFVADDRMSGDAPLPRHRHDEVIFVFNELKHSQLEPQLFETQDDTTLPLRAACPAAYRKKGLLVRLFPYLIEFLGCRDATLKSSLLELLRLASHEFGLPPADSLRGSAPACPKP